jgi:hypothetical protein
MRSAGLDSAESGSGNYVREGGNSRAYDGNPPSAKGWPGVLEPPRVDSRRREGRIVALSLTSACSVGRQSDTADSAQLREMRIREARGIRQTGGFSARNNAQTRPKNSLRRLAV